VSKWRCRECMGRACAKQSAWVHRIVSSMSAIGSIGGGRRSGALALWRFGALALLRFGAVALLRCCAVALLRCCAGYVIARLRGRIWAELRHAPPQTARPTRRGFVASTTGHGLQRTAASRWHNVRTRQFTAAGAPHWRPVPVRVKYRAFRDCVGAEGTSAGPPRRTVMDERRVSDPRQTPSRHQMDAAHREAGSAGGATILTA
jgi:hypothetical protein